MKIIHNFRRIGLMTLLMLLMQHLCAQITFYEVTTPEAGKLETTLGDDKDSIVALRVMGNLNATDITTLQTMLGFSNGKFVDCNLRILDLSQAHIVEGGEPYGVLRNKTEAGVIGREMFAWCYGLVAIALPEDTKKIDENVFGGCNNLLECVMPNGIDSIGRCAFQMCWFLQYVKLPASLKYIGELAFERCMCLKELYIPDEVTVIETNAFARCDSIETVRLSPVLKELHPGAFQENFLLKEIEIPGGVKEIGNRAFYRCGSLQKVKLNEGTEVIGPGAFELCEVLSDINLPKSTKMIDGWAFYRCNSLKELHLPDSITEIGQQAFSASNWRQSTSPHR